MRIVFNYLKLKEDFYRIELLHWGHFAFVLMGLTFELVNGIGILNWLLSSLLISIFYKSFFVTKKELFYSFWSFSVVLNTDKPEIDWYKFRDLFVKNGGDGFYAAWKLSYFEPLFLNID